LNNRNTKPPVEGSGSIFCPASQNASKLVLDKRQFKFTISLPINTFAAYFSQQNMKAFFKTLQSTFIPENNKDADIHKTNIKMWECFSTILGYFRVIHNKTTGIPCITT